MMVPSACPRPCCCFALGDGQIANTNHGHLHVSVSNRMMDGYVKCGRMADARSLFDSMHHRSVVSWNIIILAYASKGQQPVQALQLYAQMQQQGFAADAPTLLAALKACISLAAVEEAQQDSWVKAGCLEKGRSIHSRAVAAGFDSHPLLANTLLHMYAKCGSMSDAHHLFLNNLPHPDVVSWNAIILGHAEKPRQQRLALQAYASMLGAGVAPNDRSFVAILKACASLASSPQQQVDGGNVVLKMWCLQKGRAIHAQALQAGFRSNPFVGSALMDMYVKCGSMADARTLLLHLPSNVVAPWNAMILAYAEQGESEEAFALYAQMQRRGLSPDSWTFVGMLKACANTAALEAGRQIHAHVRRLGFHNSAMVATSLINMYAKCGSMAEAQRLFRAVPAPDLVTWNALIAGYASQGSSDLVFSSFATMVAAGIQPDGVTFLSLFTVCAHVGLVEQGQNCFQAMTAHYALAPTIEHYNCMVGMLGGAGHVDKAMAMLADMPFQPNLVSWRTLLAACRKWNDVDIGRHAFERVTDWDAHHPAAYAMMSNIYADAQLWEEHDDIQAMWNKRKRKMMPGHSWGSDAAGMVHTFLVGDKAHPQTEHIYAKLTHISAKLLEGRT